MSVFEIESKRKYGDWEIKCVGKNMQDVHYIVIAQTMEHTVIAELVGPDQIRLSQAADGVLTLGMVFDGEAINNSPHLRDKVYFHPDDLTQPRLIDQLI